MAQALNIKMALNPIFMQNQFRKELDDMLKAELDQLNGETVEINGKTLTAGQCYHFETSPPHLMFNTNCPDLLKNRINEILRKYRYKGLEDDSVTNAFND